MAPKTKLHLAISLALIFGGVAITINSESRPQWQLEVEETSAFSKMRIQRLGDVRRLVFVRDSGEEVTQSSISLVAPHQPLLPYMRAMFASYLYQPDQRRALVVGLGGGGMIHFLRHYDPSVQIDVVEIDPVVVRLAKDHFQIRQDEKTTIFTADGLVYLQETTERYDAIYMDAFLRPSADTDGAGVPQRLKTIAFYRTVREKLNPGGCVVFNLNTHAELEEDIATLREAFSATQLFDCPGARNLVAVCLTAETLPATALLFEQAARLDRRFGANFSFVDVLHARRP